MAAGEHSGEGNKFIGVEPPLVLQRFLPYRLSVCTHLVSDVIASAYQRLFELSVPEWRLVKRRVNPEDRRAQLLQLSPKGREVYQAVAPKALELGGESGAD